MSHYFDETPAAPSDQRRIRVALPDVTFGLRTDRGVFSQGRLDTGTEILLRNAPAPPTTGDLLDLGAGAGPIALTLALRAPATRVWAVDVNERARALCATSAAENGLANVHVAAPEDVPLDVQFSAIWTNPPIRIGKPALHALLATWLARLADDGWALLVVHRHLGSDSLQRWLTEQGWPTSRLSSAKGYRLLLVERPA